jgi:protease I
MSHDIDKDSSTAAAGSIHADAQAGRTEAPVLAGMRVAILVTDMFEQVELTGPRQALQQAGATTVIVAPSEGQVQGAQHEKKADSFDVQEDLATAYPDDFDALVLPGGTLNADALRTDNAAQRFVKRMEDKGKPIAVICHGPWLLVSAGLVNGRTLTSWPSLADDIRNAGGEWVDQEVVRDGNWVSSRKPDDIPAFNREMVALFSEHLGESRAARAPAENTH